MCGFIASFYSIIKKLLHRAPSIVILSNLGNILCLEKEGKSALQSNKKRPIKLVGVPYEPVTVKDPTPDFAEILCLPGLFAKSFFNLPTPDLKFTLSSLSLGR